MLLKAVIMAGGEGTRLRPLTSNRPKPMVPLCNKPIMEHSVNLLREHNVKDIIVTLYYLPSLIVNYFGDGSAFGVSIKYSVERSPLGTAGGIKKVEDLLDDTFIVISGDVFTNINLTDIVRFHKKKGALVTIALTRVTDPTEYGIALLDDEFRIRKFLEKPSWSEVFSNLVNMGIYVMEPDVLRLIPKDKKFDFSRDLFPLLLKKDEALYGYVAEGSYWSDLGNHEQYLNTHYDILDGKVKIPIEESRAEEGVFIGEGAIIEDGARIEPPVIIGKWTRVRRGAKVGPFTVIGPFTIVEEGARVSRSVIWDHVYVGSNAKIRGAIIASNCKIGEGAAIFEEAVVGDECQVGNYAIIRARVKIWPFKVIDPYTMVSMNIKWGMKWPRTIFGPWGIEGVVNIELTPELATRIGLAIGTWLGRGKAIAVARDPYRSSRMIKRAIVSGLIASGLKVYNLRIAPTPVLRHYVRSMGIDGGVMVETSVVRPNVVKIKVFNKEGVEIDVADERRIEGIVQKEEYRRVLSDEIGEIVYPAEFTSPYIKSSLKAIDVKAIRAAELRIVIDCLSGSSSTVIPQILDRLNVDVLLMNSRTDDNAVPLGICNMPKNLDTISSIVKTLHADMGIVFDEDADRIVVIDDKGRRIPGDLALALFAHIALEKRKGTIVVPSTASRAVEEIAYSRGGSVIRTKTGAKYVLRDIVRHRAVFGGEERGTYAFPEFQVGFDGIYSMLKLMEYMAHTGEKLSKLYDSMPMYFMLRREVKVPYERRGELLRLLLEELREQEVDTVDGIKVLEAIGWVLIHPRPDEPLVDIYAESPKREDAEVLIRKYLTLIDGIIKGVS
mgnify:CR=1 FL=1